MSENETESPNSSPIRSVENENETHEREDNFNNNPEPPKEQIEDHMRTSDARSVFVGNVDYGAGVDELQAHFMTCGTINRITILTDKWTGRPKGFAFIEFAEEESVDNALLLNDSLFRNRQLKVTTKRANYPVQPGQRRPRPPSSFAPFPPRRPYHPRPRRRPNYYSPYG